MLTSPRATRPALPSVVSAWTMKDNGLTAESGPTTEYAEYLEYGTRFMEAQPFIKPAFDKQAEKFKRDMKKLTE